jgi:hypothetical protein
VGLVQQLPHQLPQGAFAAIDLLSYSLVWGIWLCESKRLGWQPPPQPKSADYLGDMDLPPSDDEEEFEADETERRDVDLSKMETDKDAKKKAIKEAQKAARIAAEKAAAMVDEDDAFTVRELRVGRSNGRRIRRLRKNFSTRVKHTQRAGGPTPSIRSEASKAAS